MDDINWRQRAKRDWFKGGNRNTNFFHAWATQPRRSNEIHSILDAAGFRRSSTDTIGEAFTSYFKSLFSFEGPTVMEYCLYAVAQRVTPEMNLTILKEFTREEIVHALGEMQPLKVPSPDGFGACFFQHHWNVIGDQVKHAIMNFLNLNIFDSSINHTFLALIPKNAQADFVSNFCPISLCNVIYKLIAKVLANRIKQVLLFGDIQTTKCLSPWEAYHGQCFGCIRGAAHYEHKNERQEGVHGHKARYEQGLRPSRVVISRSNYEETWLCRSVDFFDNDVCKLDNLFCLSERQPYGEILPVKGPQAGGSFVPIFVSPMLTRAEHEGRISGVPISFWGTKLNHLFFTNDSLLFCRASPLEWCNIQEVLKKYE